jgi:hypothetical protein
MLDGLENVRDVDFDEDRSQIRSVADPYIMASLRDPGHCPDEPELRHNSVTQRSRESRRSSLMFSRCIRTGSRGSCVHKVARCAFSLAH